MRTILRYGALQLFLLLFGVTLHHTFGQTPAFNYSKYLTGPPATLSAWIAAVDTSTGAVGINGVDIGSLSGPFTWIWGDGAQEDGWFPMAHSYADRTKNYHVQVISNYTGGGHDTVDLVVHFTAPAIDPVALPPATAVHVPGAMIPLGAHYNGTPTWLAVFADSFFTVVPRSTVEYILSVAAAIEMEFTNDNVYLSNGKFEEYMFRDSTFGGAYSLWYTDPVSFGVGDNFLAYGIGYSSMFHEMGHNFTLNSPSGFLYGGHTDGNASAIFSESMAQIYAHAAGYELVNHYADYRLPEDVMVDVKQEVVRTIQVVRAKYEEYLSTGKPFASWNDPSTPEDEVFDTFMTIAYKFCEHAESAGAGYRGPLKRMMTLLQLFDADMLSHYAPADNTADADTFRSTLMVAAVSFAFASDLRAEFRALNFPVSDQIYTELYDAAVPVEMVSFGASCAGSAVMLSWKTATEVNNYGFEIERRPRSLPWHEEPWRKIGFVEGGGTSNVPRAYAFTDRAPRGGTYAYRLRQVDRDGTSTYSKTVEVSIALAADEYHLGQNYPNPFNPATEIFFALQKAGRARVDVYNALGAHVATVFDRQAEADAPYHVIFDGRMYPSGTYFYVLRADGRLEVKKMMLVK